MPLTDESCEAAAAVVARCDAVVAAWIFGSVARGEDTPSSDLDVAVLLRGPVTNPIAEQLRALSVDLGTLAPSEAVDIVILGPQGPVFRHRVLREGRLVLDRDPAFRRDFEARTIAQYLDWRPTHDIAMASSLAGLRRRFGGDAP